MMRFHLNCCRLGRTAQLIIAEKKVAKDDRQKDRRRIPSLYEEDRKRIFIDTLSGDLKRGGRDTRKAEKDTAYGSVRSFDCYGFGIDAAVLHTEEQTWFRMVQPTDGPTDRFTRD